MGNNVDFNLSLGCCKNLIEGFHNPEKHIVIKTSDGRCQVQLTDDPEKATPLEKIVELFPKIEGLTSRDHKRLNKAFKDLHQKTTSKLNETSIFSFSNRSSLEKTAALFKTLFHTTYDYLAEKHAPSLHFFLDGHRNLAEYKEILARQTSPEHTLECIIDVLASSLSDDEVADFINHCFAITKDKTALANSILQYAEKSHLAEHEISMLCTVIKENLDH